LTYFHPIFTHFELGTCAQHVDEPSEATGLKGPKNGIVRTPDGDDSLSDAEWVSKNEGERMKREYEWEEMKRDTWRSVSKFRSSCYGDSHVDEVRKGDGGCLI
jgi:hypothetical protein